MRDKSKQFSKNIIKTKVISTPLGDMVAAAIKDSIVMFSFYEKYHIEAYLEKLKDHFDAEVIPSEDRYFDILKLQIDEYFLGKRKEFTIPLKLIGSSFQISVWKELLNIPYGQTISYKTQATNIGKDKAYRAVANANGQNMIDIIVPCHRVIGSDGKLHGYGAGVDKKEFLLNLEKQDLINFL